MNLRVLCVDDDPIALEMYAAALESAGCIVDRCENAQQALDNIAAGQARIVVTDWEMPGMSGDELCRRLRQTGGRYIYVIMATGRSSLQDALAAMDAGADDFLRKPVEPMELVARVNAAKRVLSLEGKELVIFALARLAESRDTETGQHLERTRSYCRILARELLARKLYPGVVDDAFVSLIEATSPLHDIGKIAIPDAVLLKPGRLSPAEYEVMKTHTTIGAQTLEAAMEQFPDAAFLHMARDIALCHHERIDGTGYPCGLTGDDIPLAARIMAVADVYDALVSERHYKPAFSHEHAMSIIHDGSGKHLDPTLVTVFDQLENSVRRIANAADPTRRAAA